MLHWDVSNALRALDFSEKRGYVRAENAKAVLMEMRHEMSMRFACERQASKEKLEALGREVAQLNATICGFALEEASNIERIERLERDLAAAADQMQERPTCRKLRKALEARQCEVDRLNETVAVMAAQGVRDAEFGKHAVQQFNDIQEAAARATKEAAEAHKAAKSSAQRLVDAEALAAANGRDLTAARQELAKAQRSNAALETFIGKLQAGIAELTAVCRREIEEMGDLPRPDTVKARCEASKAAVLRATTAATVAAVVTDMVARSLSSLKAAAPPHSELADAFSRERAARGNAERARDQLAQAQREEIEAALLAKYRAVLEAWAVAAEAESRWASAQGVTAWAQGKLTRAERDVVRLRGDLAVMEELLAETGKTPAQSEVAELRSRLTETQKQLTTALGSEFRARRESEQLRENLARVEKEAQERERCCAEKLADARASEAVEGRNAALKSVVAEEGLLRQMAITAMLEPAPELPSEKQMRVWLAAANEAV